MSTFKSTQNDQQEARRGTGRTPGVLWASAAILAAMIITQAGRQGAAYAEMSSSYNGYSVVTTTSNNQELLYVIDERTEKLMIYEASAQIGQGRISLLAVEDLPSVFSSARAFAN